jgi:hypothetical protein
MGRARWAALIVGGALVAGLAALGERAPGYMDADYYWATAREIAGGRGLREPFLWNYLDDPTGLPHPSHLYWMPLTSFVAAAGAATLGEGFRAAQFPMFLLTAALPAATAALSLRLFRRPVAALLAGALAAFSGFYLPYFVTTDTFILYTYTGAAALWLTAEASARPSWTRWLGTGVAIGFAHMTRADGALLLLPALLAALRATGRRGLWSGGVLLGYILVMGGWWARNVAAIGTPLAPGLTRSLWLTDYDELFTYPASLLSAAHLASSGLAAFLGARLWALGENLKTLIGVNGLVFLLPLMAWGAWRERGRPIVRTAAIYLVLLLAAMSLVFPFAGARGGFFHSSTALMPLLWALAPVGLEEAVAWGARKRGWEGEQAGRVFAGAVVVLAAALTAGLYVPKVIGGPWDASQQTYAEAARMLRELDADPGVVCVNNPPGFHLASGFPAVVIPNGGAESLGAVVEAFDAGWVLLEANHPPALADLYARPDSLPWLEWRATLEDMHGRPLYLLQVLPSGGAP